MKLSNILQIAWRRKYLLVGTLCAALALQLTAFGHKNDAYLYKRDTFQYSEPSGVLATWVTIGRSLRSVLHASAPQLILDFSLLPTVGVSYYLVSTSNPAIGNCRWFVVLVVYLDAVDKCLSVLLCMLLTTTQ
jgi:hypothetical protein